MEENYEEVIEMEEGTLIIKGKLSDESASNFAKYFFELVAQLEK